MRKFILSIFIFIAAVLTINAQAITMADAQTILENARYQHKNRTSGSSMTPEDQACIKSLEKLRHDFFSSAQQKPDQLPSLAATYLEAHKELLRKKPIFIYQYFNSSKFTPYRINFANQRNYIRITSDKNVITTAARAEAFAAHLANVIKTSQELPGKEIFRHGRTDTDEVKISSDGLTFITSSSNGRVSVYLEGSPKDSQTITLGRVDRNAPKEKLQKYMITPENLRAWYLQMAELNPRTKTAPALRD